MTDHYDVIVIGSGAGGGTLAHALAPTGKRVLLLERGDFMPREMENWDSKAVWLRQALPQRRAVDRRGDRQDSSPRSSTTTSAATPRSTAPSCSGSASRTSARSSTSTASRRPGRSATPTWSPGTPGPSSSTRCTASAAPTRPSRPPTRPYPFPAISHEPRIAQLSADLAGAGLHPFPLPNGILLDEAAPWQSACIRCATCDGYACPTNGKADAAVIAVEPALRYPNVTLLTDALVTRLETGRRRAHRRPAWSSSATVRSRRYSADVVVRRPAAPSTRPRCCCARPSEQHPDGLGNGSGAVGRNLMLHNNSSLIAFSKTPNPTKFQKTLGINDFYYGDPDSDWPFPLGAMQMLGKSDATLIGFDVKDHPDPAEVARHALDFWLTTEDLPLADNRVTVDADGGISLRYTPTNLEAHRRLRAKFEGLLSAMQCRDEVYENLSYVGGRLGIAGVAHQNGTVRFGTDPATSVLDLDCRCTRSTTSTSPTPASSSPARP